MIRSEVLGTTSAREAFVGSFACFLAQSRTLEESIRRANKIAA